MTYTAHVNLRDVLPKEKAMLWVATEQNEVDWANAHCDMTGMTEEERRNYYQVVRDHIITVLTEGVKPTDLPYALLATLRVDIDELIKHYPLHEKDAARTFIENSLKAGLTLEQPVFTYKAEGLKAMWVGLGIGAVIGLGIAALVICARK